NGKEEAEAVLGYFGLTVSDAIRLTLTRVARDKALPLELKMPNAETQAAMAESRAMMAVTRWTPGFAGDFRPVRRTGTA
ncbi:type II toxin-antitoxin system RelB/DinJ family antitoxin, partial [Mycobacterium tuberculosis]|nr:type II toxin-antitoxin system RelB/DinJ family antitoxin [Mycobacterium tuberculosis]